MRLLFSDISLQRLKKNARPRYHRGSLAAFLALVKRRVSADWNVVMEIFLELVGTDSSILMSRIGWSESFMWSPNESYVQELKTVWKSVH